MEGAPGSPTRTSRVVPRSLTLEEFLDEDWSSPPFPGGLFRGGGGALHAHHVPSAWDVAVPVPPLPPTPPPLSEDGLEGDEPRRRPRGRDMLSPATTDAPSQVPTLNALEAEESTASDASLAMDDRIGLSRAVAKLAKELRKVSVTRREHAVLRKEEMEAEEARKAAIAAATQHHQCSENFERLARGGESKTRQEPVTAEPVAVQEFRPVAATVSSLQGLFASPNLPVELRRFPQMLAEVLRSRTSESESSRTVSKSDLEAAAIAMAQKMVDLEGQLGSVQSSWVGRLQEALARQREQEAELEKELHLQRLHMRHLTHDIAEAKLRRQQLEEEQAEFVPFATKELEDAMKQVASNRRAPESLRRLVNTTAPRVAFDPPRQKTRSSSSTVNRRMQRFTPRRGFEATFGRIPV